MRPGLAALVTMFVLSAPFAFVFVNSAFHDVVADGPNDDIGWALVARHVLTIGVATAVAAGATVDRTGPIRPWNVLASGACAAACTSLWFWYFDGYYLPWLASVTVVIATLLGAAIAIRFVARFALRRELVAIVGICTALLAVLLLVDRIDRSYRAFDLERMNEIGIAE
ncbi:MAG: hypothetical protein JWM86_2204 [Thermoleophilia bacterium]|nr:hypothetical protein [Thermoleophilia bacterium]